MGSGSWGWMVPCQDPLRLAQNPAECTRCARLPVGRCSQSTPNGRSHARPVTAIAGRKAGRLASVAWAVRGFEAPRRPNRRGGRHVRLDSAPYRVLPVQTGVDAAQSRDRAGGPPPALVLPPRQTKDEAMARMLSWVAAAVSTKRQLVGRRAGIEEAREAFPSSAPWEHSDGTAGRPPDDEAVESEGSVFSSPPPWPLAGARRAPAAPEQPPSRPKVDSPTPRARSLSRRDACARPPVASLDPCRPLSWAKDRGPQR